MSEHFQPTFFDAKAYGQTLSVAVSPARTLAPEDRARAFMEAALGSSSISSVLLASFDQNSSSWRTSQRCLVEGWTLFSGPWPRSGTMRNGIASRLPPLAIRTRGTVSGLLPTPRHCDGEKGAGARKDGGGSYGLGYTVARLLGLKQQTTTKFDPNFSGLLMGYPTMWTNLPPTGTP